MAPTPSISQLEPNPLSWEEDLLASSDGSDDFGKNSLEGIFLRIVVNGKPDTIFLGLQESDYQDAGNLWKSIQAKLCEMGITMAIMNNKLVGVLINWDVSDLYNS